MHFNGDQTVAPKEEGPSAGPLEVAREEHFYGMFSVLGILN